MVGASGNVARRGYRWEGGRGGGQRRTGWNTHTHKHWQTILKFMSVKRQYFQFFVSAVFWELKKWVKGKENTCNKTCDCERINKRRKSDIAAEYLYTQSVVCAQSDNTGGGNCQTKIFYTDGGRNSEWGVRNTENWIEETEYRRRTIDRQWRKCGREEHGNELNRINYIN